MAVEQILLGSLASPTLRVVNPITVEFEDHDDSMVTATAVEWDEIGWGPNRSEALLDLQQALVELFLTLEKDQASLGADLYMLWRSMQRKIERRIQPGVSYAPSR